MTASRPFIWVILACLFWVGTAQAHEVRPAFLKLTETGPAEFSVLWKQPVIDGQRLKLDPQFPQDCRASTPTQTVIAATVSDISTLYCPLTSGIIRIEGLGRTLTDVFIEINYENGNTRRALVKPSQPEFDLGEAAKNPARDYLAIGIDHIIRGWDHLFFIIGLTFLVTRRQIWGVATAFTLAHSLTLSLAAFGLLNIPTRPVEILIAVSILLLAVEVMRKYRGGTSLAIRKPYLVSFAVGLIHGCGFASALSDIGLPKGTELLALLLFNVGVELGQFGVIALTIFALFGLGKIHTKWPDYARMSVTYIIATIAVFWAIERGAAYFV